MKGMLYLANIEFLKLRRDRSFWILTALFASSVTGANYMAAGLAANGPLAGVVDFSFPSAWKVVSFISSFLLVMPCLVIIMHACSEHVYRTHRQNVIDGLSRGQYVTAKLLLVAGLSLFSTLLVVVLAFALGLPGERPVSFAGFEHAGYFFVQATMYISLAFLVALVVKKSALAIGLFCFYAFVIENMLEKYLDKLHHVGQLLPLASSDHLLAPGRLMRIADMGTAWSPPALLLASVVWIGACLLACYYKYKKQDL
ncbi:MAG: ABC transporter permease [Odoribacteraceae bacterium]|jgi:ABC-type transport system involved in multi-copper enzyme maturation permease subunit|nr:ABC transporter permease [Odoribacteraceae bacterium]